MHRLRSVLYSVSKRDRSDLPLLSVVREKGVIKRSVSCDDENHNYIPDDLSNYKVVEKGQFAMNKMKAWQGSFGISKFDGIVSPAYFVFNLIGVDANFFHTAIRSKAYVPFFTQASDGIRVGQWDLNQTRMKEIPFWIPLIEEQQQISRYLDWKTSQINKFIKAKKRMIELLKEQKQVIINDAVTGKIDVRSGKPYPNYKDSGVEWLGKIPEGWEVRKLRTLLSQKTIKNKPSSRLLSVVRDKGVIIRDIEDFQENRNFIPDDLSSYKYVRIGQFAMNKMKAWQGSYGISKYEGIVSPAYFVFDIRFENLNFFNYAIRSKSYVSYFAKSSDGIRIGQWDLSLQKMKEIPFVVPPSNIQEIIVEFIPRSVKVIESSIAKMEREIELLQEFRARHIADVVTGKVDVRDVEVPDHYNEDGNVDIDDISEIEGDIEEETVDNDL